MNIKEAKVNDVPQMVSLSEEKRTIYESYQPVFWRKAKYSSEVQTVYFESVLLRDNYISLVCEDGQNLSGFLFGAVIKAPAAISNCCQPATKHTGYFSSIKQLVNSIKCSSLFM